MGRGGGRANERSEWGEWGRVGHRWAGLYGIYLYGVYLDGVYLARRPMGINRTGSESRSIRRAKERALVEARALLLQRPPLAWTENRAAASAK